MNYRDLHVSSVQNKTPSVLTRGNFIFDYVIILLELIRNLGLLFS